MKRFLLIVLMGFMPGIACVALADDEFTAIDLQPYANQKLAEGFGTGHADNNLSELPTGDGELGNCKFHVGEGLIQLGSTVVKKTMPERVEGIKVDRKFAKLHILHATHCGGGPIQPGDPWFVNDDTLIGEYRINFEDRSAIVIPIIYGQDVRDWFYVDNDKEPGRSQVVWKGDNGFAKNNRSRIRLYATTWENPWPDKVVKTIDYSSKKKETPAAPFCIAITAEGIRDANAAVSRNQASDSIVPKAEAGAGSDLAARMANDNSPKFGFYTVAHYDDARNPADDLAKTVERAKAENKHILIQVGGDWCGWCKLMSRFIETNDDVRENISRNYLLMKVTFDQKQTNEKFLSQYPAIHGYPHLFVLDSDGKLLHSQDTSELEQGQGYNQQVYLEFLDKWKPGR